MSGGSDGPTRLGAALRQYLDRSGLAERIDEARVVPEWEERVGEAIAGVTTPLRVSNGVLIVAVRSSAWLMELKMMEGEILRRLNRDSPGGAAPAADGREKPRIRQIRFVMSRE